ncbi:hypothetical protein R1sor_016462 [Riccia sorocarpa]|uniref:Uncharacterized protein n=1 Tax=Riccia sorocarpa TaxID=122646 RepID=A0ABD3HF11_9MARC
MWFGLSPISADSYLILPGVSQVELNRSLEQELKRADLAIIIHNVESIEVVARAVARVEELCKSSNSKGVYLNRCVRALASTEYEVKVTEVTATLGDQKTAEARIEDPQKPEVDEVVRKALEDTGLVDSPTSEPEAEHDDPDKEDPEDCGSAPRNLV